MSDVVDRRANDPWRAQVSSRIDDLEKNLSETMRVTHENNVLILEIKGSTDEIVQFFESGRGFFRVVRGVGTAARVVGYIAGAAGILWVVTKFGIGQLLADMGINK